jgi:hypothetical protein
LSCFEDMESLNGEVRKVKVYLIVERRVSKNFAVDFIWRSGGGDLELFS